MIKISNKYKERKKEKKKERKKEYDRRENNLWSIKKHKNKRKES